MRFIMVCALACVGMLSPAAAQASMQPEEATDVGYARIERQGRYDWTLNCTTTDALTDFAVAFTTENFDGSTEYFDEEFTVEERNAADGRAFQVHDNAITIEERTEHPRGTVYLRAHGSTFSENASGVRGHLAWASWGGTVACEVVANGRTVTAQRPPGARAMYVGPEAFRGGAFVRAEGEEASIGRVFHTTTGGGPLFALLIVGDTASGHIVADDPNGRIDLVPLCLARECTATYTGASQIAGVVGAGTEIHDGYGDVQMWIIDLPRGV